MKQFFFSTKALIMNGDQFLAMYKKTEDNILWDLPGGRMEFGETAEETLAREIREELDVEINPIKLIDTWNYLPNKDTQITGVIYYCEIVSGDISISDEHDGYRWISIQDIGEEFTREFFIERMKLWNWDLITNNSIKFKKVE